MNKSDFKSQRIYVNTFTQKTQGNDHTLTVDLGQPFTFKTLRLDQCFLENFWTNYYKSTKYDFTDFTFKIRPPLLPEQLVNITVDQYIGSTGNSAIANLVTFLNTATNNVFSITGTQNNSAWLQGLITIQMNGNWIPIGDGFRKLGMITQPATSPLITNSQSSQQAADFSQTSSIMISIDNLPPAISNGYGTSSYVVANNSSFGNKLYYQSSVYDTCQILRFQNKVTVDQFQLRLLNCDQRELTTTKFNNTDNNMLNPEYVFVFTATD